ncbi:MAG: hypothetical protein ACUVX8_05120 [Candidatus Zipacnadales bacterium]
MISTLILSALLASLAAFAAERVVPIDDFESDLRAWIVNDGLVAKFGKATIPQILLVTPGAPRTLGSQAALIEFGAGQSTWASVTRTVDGEAWVNAGCTGLSLWLRGDGSRHVVTLVLRSYVKSGNKVTDISYKRDIVFTTADWFKLQIPFVSFKDDTGTSISPQHLRTVKLFQFVKTGSWAPLRFITDAIHAKELPASELPVPSAEAVLVDFDALDRPCLLRHDICLGSRWGQLLGNEHFAMQVRGALGALGRPMVRIKLSDYYVPGGREVKSAELAHVLSWIRAGGFEPLLCLDQPMPIAGLAPNEGWRKFGAFCADLAQRRRGEPGEHYYEIGNEPVFSGQFFTIEQATEIYNALATQVLMADPLAKVGGMGFASPWDEHLTYFIQHARSLAFLSFHFYGAHSSVAEDDTLFEVACRAKSHDLPHQMTPEGIRALLAKRSGHRPEIWITECALSSAREPSGQARDRRVQSCFGAAWLTAFSLAVASTVDRVFWFKAFGDGWGLLRDDGSPTASFHAVTMLTQTMPASAMTTLATHFGTPVYLAPVADGPRRTVVIAVGTASATVSLQLTGTPPPKPLRLRRLNPASSMPTFDPLSPSLRQRLTLWGPGWVLLEATNG